MFGYRSLSNLMSKAGPALEETQRRGWWPPGEHIVLELAGMLL